MQGNNFDEEQLDPHGECRAEIESLREDAEKWRALRASARITAMGSAGLNNPNTNGYAHVTLNFWTIHSAAPDALALEWLDKYVAIARRVRSQSDVQMSQQDLSDSSPA